MTARASWIVGLACLALPATGGAAPESGSACVTCHSNSDMFDEQAVKIAAEHAGDVHAQVGLSCHDCHGGNPDAALAEDPAGSMDETYKANPFRGAPGRRDIPGFCGRCHSDIAYMRRFKPDARTDQEREYRTSHHGKRLAAGDTNVATCVDCHGSHGIRGPADPLSSVHPTRVAETCQTCHADPERMRSYTLADGRPLPVDQYARWRQSVHAAALLEREDLSAPTCNDCHGNHGATPPGLDSIAFVCGQCHGREAELFRGSPKRVGFENHNPLLADAGEDGCAACHEAPQSKVTLRALSECESCHGNHAILRPSIAMLSPLPETPCAFCHEVPEGSLIAVDEPETVGENYAATRDGLLAQARSEGIADDLLFDWLVDQAQTLPFHLRGGEAGHVPEFSRLLQKFRIGKTHFVYRDPATGEDVRAPILRCDTCHGDDGEGIQTAHTMLAQIRGLAVRTARAERILLAARRGGVETREAGLQVDKAVDAHIEMQVALHAFSADETSRFAEKHAEGLEQAQQALETGSAALDELRNRRRGLFVSLVFIVLVLVGLSLKIRQTSA